MKKSTKGLLAGVAGIALLAGGGTFALWSDSAPVHDGTITSGNLELTAGTGDWFDISPDKTNPGTSAINLSTFRVVPGDILEMTQEVTVIAEGDNLVATLGVNDGTATGELATGMEVTYSVLDDLGGNVVTDEPIATVSSFSVDSTDADGDVYTVTVRAEFDSTTANRDLTQATMDLAGLTLDLNQIRP